MIIMLKSSTSVRAVDRAHGIVEADRAGHDHQDGADDRGAGPIETQERHAAAATTA